MNGVILGALVYEILIIYIVFLHHRSLCNTTTSLQSIENPGHESVDIKQRHQMLIDISHSLQTPLTVICGELEMIADSSINPEKIIACKQSLHRSSECIRQLLHLTKLEHGGGNKNFEVIELSQVINEQYQYLEVMGSQERVSVTARIAAGIYMEGDQCLIEEMIIAVAHNAIKYRRHDTVSTLHIGLDAEAETTTLSFVDNGIGITAEDSEYIFDRYYRGRAAQTHASGFGIGLAIVKKIVDLHQGTIKVSSVPHEGTLFDIRFPRSATTAMQHKSVSVENKALSLHYMDEQYIVK